MAVIVACAILALAVDQLWNVLRQSKGKRVAPIGALVFASVLGISITLLETRALAFEIIRLVTLAALAWATSEFAVRAIGRTALAWSIITGAIALALLEAFHLLAPLSDLLDAQAIVAGGFRISTLFVIRAVVIVGGLFWLAQRLSDLLERGMPSGRMFSRSGNVLFAKLARAALLTAALLLSLAFLGVDITALAVLSGAVGLGLGFGLQKIVSNYVSGLILLMDKSVKPGDVIELDLGTSRVRGEVTELAGRYTAITLRTGTETLIPNEVLISTPVINWSHTSRNVQLRIPVGVAYSTDVEKAMALCVEAAKAAKRVLVSPAPVCFIKGFGDSSVDLEARFWISDAESGVRNVSSAVYLEIWKRFKAEGIEIPFPQRDLHIRSSVSIPVASTKDSDAP